MKCPFREWACPVEIRGFEPRYPDIRGGDSVQLFAWLSPWFDCRIEDFIEKGAEEYWTRTMVRSGISGC